MAWAITLGHLGHGLGYHLETFPGIWPGTSSWDTWDMAWDIAWNITLGHSLGYGLGCGLGFGFLHSSENTGAIEHCPLRFLISSTLEKQDLTDCTMAVVLCVSGTLRNLHLLPMLFPSEPHNFSF